MPDIRYKKFINRLILIRKNTLSLWQTICKETCMNKILNILTIFSFVFTFAQLGNIKSGERLHYRIHYGPLNAGTATLTTLKTNYQGVPHFYVKGEGRSTGAVRAFFPVDDLYESFININTGLPSFYVRNVKEGGYSQHLQTAFNHSNQTLILTDKKNPANGSKTLKSVRGIQDMLSAFYHLRGRDDLTVGKTIRMNVWIDDEMFAFQLKVNGTENVKTKFGTINCLKITPMVMSGRVFKAKESVTMWVSNDENKVPIAIKAELAVGSLRADLERYSNVMYDLNFKK